METQRRWCSLWVIAQDIEKVLPHAITEKKVPFYDGDRKPTIQVQKRVVERTRY